MFPSDSLEQSDAPPATPPDHLERLATLGSMAAGAAHEVNNLLTPALAYSQLAQRSNDPRMLRKAVDRSVAGIEAAARILGAILEFSQPDRGSQEGASIVDALEAAIGCLPRDPTRDRIEIVRDVADDARVGLTPLLLQQILLNLLLNACRALRGREGATVRVTTLAESASALGEHGMTIITVADNGPGIPAEVRDRLFEPFVTAPIGATARGGGSGLGLAICRRVIESAGGAIRNSETAGGGATFELRIPTWLPGAMSQAG